MAEPLTFSNYQASYRTHVGNLVEASDKAMSLAIGGQYEPFGLLMRQVLLDAGLQNSNYLIDAGCGSGRLAHVLNVDRYLGTDIVPELLDHARTRCPNPNWRFELVEDIVIPEGDGVADMVCFFSVFTHLLHEDTYRYLREAHRVLKPGGTLVFSFLEFKIASHWAVFTNMIVRPQGSGHHNQFISRDAVASWCAHLGFSVDATFDGDTPHIRVDVPIQLDNGRMLEGMTSLGQSVCVLSKTA